MSTELKIKSKSLAAEARIIREEERRLCRRARHQAQRQRPADKLRRTRLSLYEHRVHDVRSEARATFIARAFLAGREVGEADNSQPPKHIVQRAYRIAKKYSPAPIEEGDFLAWAGWTHTR